MRTPIPKSWTRKRYSPTEQRRVEYLFSQDTEATDEEREAYIREQAEEIQRHWQQFDLEHRTVQQSPEVELYQWKKS